VLRLEYAVVAVPVLPPRRHEIRQAIAEHTRRERDDPVGRLWINSLLDRRDAIPGAQLP
jgi:hypothetical protein